MNFPYSFWTDIHSPKQRININGLIAYYKFDDINFNFLAYDSSPHNNNLQPLVSTEPKPTSTSGIVNSGILFKTNNVGIGNDMLALKSDSGNFDFVLRNNMNHTFAGWVYTNPLVVDAGTARSDLFHNMINPSTFSQRTAQYFMRLEFNNTLVFTVSGDSNVYDQVTGSGIIPFSGWHFFVADWDYSKQTISLQLDNSGIITKNHALTIPVQTTGTSFRVGGLEAFAGGIGNTSPLGRFNSGVLNTFGGKLDEFSIWQRLLTSGERTLLYNNGSGFSYPFIS